MLTSSDLAGGVEERECVHNDDGREAGGRGQEAGRRGQGHIVTAHRKQKEHRKQSQALRTLKLCPHWSEVQQGSALSPRILQYPDWGPSVEIHEPLGHVLMLTSTHMIIICYGVLTLM